MKIILFYFFDVNQNVQGYSFNKNGSIDAQHSLNYNGYISFKQDLTQNYANEIDIRDFDRYIFDEMKKEANKQECDCVTTEMLGQKIPKSLLDTLYPFQYVSICIYFFVFLFFCYFDLFEMTHK